MHQLPSLLTSCGGFTLTFLSGILVKAAGISDTCLISAGSQCTRDFGERVCPDKLMGCSSIPCLTCSLAVVHYAVWMPLYTVLLAGFYILDLDRI